MLLRFELGDVNLNIPLFLFLFIKKENVPPAPHDRGSVPGPAPQTAVVQRPVTRGHPSICAAFSAGLGDYIMLVPALSKYGEV